MISHLNLARLSRASYSLQTADRFTLLDVADRDGSQATFSRSKKGELVIAFAGSRDRIDWIRNALVFDLSDLRQAAAFAPLFGLQDMPGRVHTGFVRALSVLAEPLKVWVGQAAAEGQRVTLTGHSLGAAEAVYFGGFLALGTVEELVTFGCPPVGDEDYIQAFPRIPQTRYVCGFDPVPRAVEIADKFTDRNPIRLGHVVGATLLPSSLSWWKRLIPYYWKGDHEMGAYEAGLEG